MTARDTGIAAIGVKLPPAALDVRTLAELRGVDPNKFTIGLGCDQMALCPEGWDAARLGAEAAERALAHWGGDRSRIGMVAVGTETAKDMSRPLSAFICDSLALSGRIRSYEVKHACYGGTLALRQALEWRLSGAAGDKAALVIATDVALYGLESGGEPTQGAGAVAFVIDDPRVARVDLASFAYSEPAFDFWRPVGEAVPRVDGPLSLDCYKTAAAECFAEMVGEADARETLAGFDALAFHVPFPKMVKKAVAAVGEKLELSPEEVTTLFAEKVEPTMGWNRLAGNCYTAALWLSVAQQLAGKPVGARLGAFSYGSGFGAELLTLTALEGCADAPWVAEVEADLDGRELIDAEAYLKLRGA